MVRRLDSLPVYVVCGNRVLLDDILRELSRQSTIAVVGSTTNPDRVLTDIARAQPWVILVHLDLGSRSGVDIISAIDRRFPALRIIALTDQILGDPREVIRAGARDLVILPDQIATLTQSIRALSDMMQPPWDGDEGDRAIGGRLVVVASGKGGVGKTLVATSLAVALARRLGPQVALVDLSLQMGDVDLWLDIRTTRNMSDLATVMHDLTPEALDNVIAPAAHGLSVLLAPSRPEDADGFGLDDIAALLRFLKQRYPVVVVDTGVHLGDAFLVALREADSVLMVITPELPALRNAAKVLQVMGRLRYPLGRVQAVLNRVRPENTIGQRQVQQQLGLPLLGMLPDAPDTVEAMANEGKAAAVFARSALAQAIEDVTERLLPALDSPMLQARAGERARPAVSRRGPARGR